MTLRHRIYLPFYHSKNNEALRNFCAENYGNENKLSILVYDKNKGRLHGYKVGRVLLTDKFYAKLLPLIDQIRDNYPDNLKAINYNSYIDFTVNLRSEYIKNWCTEKNNRSAYLSSLVFVGMNHKSKDVALALIKKHQYAVNDDLWKKIKDAFVKIENFEYFYDNPVFKDVNIKYLDENIVLELHAPYELAKFLNFLRVKESVQSYRTITQKDVEDNLTVYNNNEPSYKARVDEWLSNDTKRKLRLANVAYGCNYDCGVDSRKFTQISRSNFINKYEWEKVNKVIDKVDQMIKSNHPFALAAMNRVVK